MLGSGLILSALGGVLTAFTKPGALLGLAGSAVLVALGVGAWWGSDRSADQSKAWQAHAQQLQRAVVEGDKRRRSDEALAETQKRQLDDMRAALSMAGDERDQALKKLEAELEARAALEKRLAGVERQPAKGSKANAPIKNQTRPAADSGGWTPRSVRVFKDARAKLRAGQPR